MSARAHRRFDGRRLVVATHNPGKLREIAALLRPFDVETVSVAALGLPEPEETGSTFVANAELKARTAATASGFPALADDSGICIDALGGAPGIYSARWAGDGKDFASAMARVKSELDALNVPNEKRTAHFISVLTLAWPDGHVESFEGRVDGHLTFPPRGLKGFGYDPIFVPEGHTETYGELEPDYKHGMSHRALAFAKLIAACFDTRHPSTDSR
jgi:XTP/dITP diphosphohydrolase